MAAKTGTMRRVERCFNEPLETLLAAWTDEGLSSEGIASRLNADGIAVTGMTIRNWIRALGGTRPLIFPTPETQNGEDGLDSVLAADSTDLIAIGIK
jgi:hypothetical protein